MAVEYSIDALVCVFEIQAEKKEDKHFESIEQNEPTNSASINQSPVRYDDELNESGEERRQEASEEDFEEF